MHDFNERITFSASESEHMVKYAIQFERERCAKIAEEMDCGEPPPDYTVGPAGLISEWERAQCWHGDRIAAAIRGE